MSHPWTYIEQDYDLQGHKIFKIYCQKHGFINMKTTLDEAVQAAETHEEETQHG